jgi:hypothetical protein
MRRYYIILHLMIETRVNYEGCVNFSLNTAFNIIQSLQMQTFFLAVSFISCIQFQGRFSFFHFFFLKFMRLIFEQRILNLQSNVIVKIIQRKKEIHLKHSLEKLITKITINYS